MQAFLAYLVANASRIFAVASLRVLISKEACAIYGGLLMLLGVIIESVAMVLLGGGILYYTSTKVEHPVD